MSPSLFFLEKKDFKRTYVLSYGPRLGHDEDVLAGKGFGCRQVVRYLNRHLKYILSFTADQSFLFKLFKSL